MNRFPLAAQRPAAPDTAESPQDAQGARCWHGRALLFDLDGTLVDSAAAIERHTRAWAARCRLDGDKVLELSHGRRDSDLVATVAPERDQREEVAWLHHLSCTDTRGIEPVPGAPDLLAALAPGDWAVVTSGAREVAEARLAAAGLPRPRVLVAAEDVRHGKPSPEGFLQGARRLGVPPSACLVFEDAPVGAEAAHAAGMEVVLVGGPGPRGVVDLRPVAVTPAEDAEGRWLTVRIDGPGTGAARR